MSAQPLGTQSAQPAPTAVNPMGTRGFEFVEFTGPDVTQLDAVMRGLGFGAVAMHRSKNVTLYRQGGINFILNGEGRVFPGNSATATAPASAPSPSASTMRRRPWRVRRNSAPGRW